jgi:hypothetical protein
VSHSDLLGAVALSQRMLEAAEAGDAETVVRLDAERLLLLKSFRLEVKFIGADDRALLQQLSHLNDRAIGLLEHQRRGKGREMDMAATGRRAVAAYAQTR